ncbi:MAG: hypothetical protein V1779_04665 [bacterium]
MKSIYYLLIVVLLLTVEGFSQPFSSNLEFQLMKEENPNFKLERKKWMEDMHRTAPGNDYKLLNSALREQKQLARKKKIEALLKSDSKGVRILSDTVGDGKLVGKWIERGSNNLAGRMLTCDIDWENNLIYNASSGGNIWRGTLEGQDWTCLNNGLQMTNIVLLKVINQNNNKRIFAVTDTRGYYSDNEGLTWEKSTGLEKPQSWGGVRRAVITNDVNHYIYFLGNEWDYDISKSVTCIYRSTDLGETFEPLYKTQISVDRCDLWTPKYYNSDVYFLHLDTLSKINNDGKIEQISKITNIDFNNYKQGRLSGTCNENGTTIYLWLQNKADNFSHFYSSSDFGSSWETLGIVDYGPFSTNSFEASCIHPEALYFGGVNCSRSHDNGKTWQIVNTWPEYYGNMEGKLHADLPAITSFMNPHGDEVVIICTDGGTYISYDNLISVQNISLHNLNVSQYYSTYSFKENPDIIFVGSQDQGFQRTTAVANDGTHSFQQTISGDYAHLTSSDGGNTVWHVYPGFSMVYKFLAQPSMTTSASLDFDSCGQGGLWMRPILADPKNPNVAYLAGGGNDGYHHIWNLTYSSGSIKWSQMPYKFSNTDVVSALGISNINKDLFYAMTNNGDFFYSTDRGQNWSKSEGFARLGGHYFYGASITPSNVDTNTVYIAGSGYNNPGAYVSYDHGQTFIPMNEGLPNTLVYRIAVSDDDEYIFAATAVGPYVYVKSDEKWYDIAGLNTPDQTFWCVEYIPSIMTARFGTYGRGIWDFKIEGVNSIAEVMLTEPVNEQEEVELKPNLKWTLSENATHFQLQVAKDKGFQEIIFQDDSVLTNNFEISELKPNGTYYWRVKAKSNKLSSTWSTAFSFKTIIVHPQIPNIIYPENNANQVPLIPVFEWEPVPFASSYHLQVSKSEDFSTFEIDEENITENTYEDLYYFSYGTIYYWRIKSKINSLESDFSETYQFTTVAPKPGAPTLVYPSFGQSDMPLNLKLIWTEVENADFYTLNLASDNQFKNMLFEKDSIYWYTYKFTDELESYKIYMWRVRANNVSGGSQWSDTRMFVTGNQVGVEELSDNFKFVISPNPFSDEVNFGIELNESASVSLRIYDLLGNEIIKLADRQFDKGAYVLLLTSDKLNKNISSNIYIANLTVNGVQMVRRIVYLK